MTRTKMTLKNIFFGTFGKLASMLLGFISRTVFIYFLGKTYLGINGLYTEILSVLSFAELGFGTALLVSMYEPVANNDEKKVVQLLNLYKKAYRIIALVITVLGLSIVPFLQYIVKGADALTLFDLRLYFLIFLTNTVTSYFVSYKSSYLNARMQNYISTNAQTLVNVVTVVTQMAVVALTHNYLAYLLTHTFLQILSRILIALYLNKKFPILKMKEAEKLPKAEIQRIFGEVKGLIIHRFSDVAVHSTDNIIISSFSALGVVTVGLVSNYNMLISLVLGFVTIIFHNLTSGFGNIVAKKDTALYRKTFYEANFINFWMYGFCSIAFYVLIPPFITLWLGSEFVIDDTSFALIVVNNYIMGQSVVYNSARVAKGNFNKDKWISLVQALINLIVSIVAAKYLGLVGVYIGTIVSRVFFTIFKPISTYRFLFSSSVKEYFRHYIVYFGAAAGALLCTNYLASFVLSDITIVRFIISGVIVAIVPNVIFALLFFSTDEFKNMISRIKSVLLMVKRRKKT